MKVLVCELCDSRDIVKQDGVYVCQSCGAKYTPEEARGMMKDVEGEAPAAAPKAESKGDLEKYLLLARRAKDSGNSADAAKYYGLAQTEDPNSWECAFYSVYFTAMQTNIAGIASAANLVSNCLATVVALIKDHTPKDQQLSAAKELAQHCNSISSTLFAAARNHYNGIGDSIRANYTGEYRQRASLSCLVASNAGTQLDKVFGSDPAFHTTIAECWKQAVLTQENNLTAFPSGVDVSDLKRISKYDPDFVRPRVQKRLDYINGEIKKLSSPTVRLGCVGVFALIIGLGFIIWGTTIQYSDVATMAYAFGALFAIPGVICCLPLPKSKKRLAADNEKIAAFEKTKAELENLCK